MLGIVDVGGGMRCVYSAGIYDLFIDKRVKIPCLVGVSAGSANLITYACSQRGRTYDFYTDFAFRPEFTGHIGFLGHGAGVKFRNVRVLDLTAKKQAKKGKARR